jgi:RNA recognition motif-containing protein
LLAEYGPLKSVSVGYNYRTKQSKGFAFVEFENRRDAEDALRKFDREVVRGRSLRLDWDLSYDQKVRHGYARPRRDFSRSPKRSPRRRSRTRSPTPRRSKSRSHSTPRRSLSRSRSISPRRSNSPAAQKRSRSPSPQSDRGSHDSPTFDKKRRVD